MKTELTATATFGLEAVVRREIEALGYKIISTEDGKVTYMGDERAVVRSNLWLRSADRVFIKIGEFVADDFETLFQNVKGFAWENIIPADGAFPVVGTSVKSALHSVPACQSIIKKAIVSRLSEFYMLDTFEEDGAMYRVRFSILKDRVTILVDTSGIALHKRGYRIADVAAPIKETLAAALVQLSFWDGAKATEETRPLVDTCCGSGTIPIEAALIARNIAPGLYRSFAAEGWDIIDRKIWKEERAKALEAVDKTKKLNIIGFDIDNKSVVAAKRNAEKAGVGKDIKFYRLDMTSFVPRESGGIVITNPPYGERIGNKKDIEKIYEKLSGIMKDDPTWSVFMITADRDIEEKFFGRKADRRRKLYNGRIETQYYQFHGEKPHGCI